MSLVPMWMDPFADDFMRDFDRPFRMMNQHFGMGLPADFMSPAWPRRSGYMPRPVMRQDSGTCTYTDDKDKFEVKMDVQHFAPEEITIKTIDNMVQVEAKHEEKSDEHGYISRHFVRKYSIPKDVKPESVVSKLSRQGVLTITAPKPAALEAPKPNERPVIMEVERADGDKK